MLGLSVGVGCILSDFCSNTLRFIGGAMLSGIRFEHLVCRYRRSISAPEKLTLVALSQPDPCTTAIFIDKNDAFIFKCTPDFTERTSKSI